MNGDPRQRKKHLLGVFVPLDKRSPKRAAQVKLSKERRLEPFKI